MIGKITTACCFIIGLLGMSSGSFAGKNQDERLLKATLRKIGHELLLRSGNETSRILPIEKENDHLVLKFEAAFQLDPEDLSDVVNAFMKEEPNITGYLVEVQTCGSKELVYSYRFAVSDNPNTVSCKGRILPKDCYEILFTVLESEIPVQEAYSKPDDAGKFAFIALLIPASLGVGWFVFKGKKKKTPVVNSPDLISIGSFQFDPVQMKLIHSSGEIELTGKESGLLLQLHASVNRLVDRDTILKSVWGDEGDYIGRTLDVFISKLRKKLEADPAVRIINIRGVGYKLVVG
ncbi:winged helix-turn-helix domain-containing protein [Fluviicola sp.]|uniref:winged helix-turn-helix domain-containing protein n=1 Tax=Fluviicola sp. TaxID=1917219 RepID=UPI002606739D|nr:winged helix-turn-helix domain-containing protein [Fluviicola sp.]